MRFVRSILKASTLAALSGCLAQLLLGWTYGWVNVPSIWAQAFVPMFILWMIYQPFMPAKNNGKESSTRTQETGKHRDSEDSKRSLDQTSGRDDSNPYRPPSERVL